VWAGPLSGSAAAPVFRTLAAVDIPPIPESGVVGLTADLASKAPLDSPIFIGTPTAPTAIVGTSNTQLATTAFVQSQIGSSAPGLAPVQSVAGKTGIVTLVEADVANLVSDLALKAPLASPAFTGNPTSVAGITIGTAGTALSPALSIANASTNAGASHLTQIATGTGISVNGVSGVLLGIADSGYKWMVNLDGSGNLGVAGAIYASALQLNLTATGGITMSGSSAAPAVAPQLNLTDGTNSSQIGQSEGASMFFTGSVAGDLCIRAVNGALRVGHGAATAPVVIDTSNNVNISNLVVTTQVQSGSSQTTLTANNQVVPLNFGNANTEAYLVTAEVYISTTSSGYSWGVYTYIVSHIQGYMGTVTNSGVTQLSGQFFDNVITARVAAAGALNGIVNFTCSGWTGAAGSTGFLLLKWLRLHTNPT
jgi:hypothetical protein